MNEAELLRADYAAALRVKQRLGAALERQQQALDAMNREPGKPALIATCEAATEEVRGLIAEAQEWVSVTERED